MNRRVELARGKLGSRKTREGLRKIDSVHVTGRRFVFHEKIAESTDIARAQEGSRGFDEFSG